jgi:uncharacterized protein YcbX
MPQGVVAGLWRYPVKSMRGEGVSALALTERGARGDRGWAVIDETSGKVASAKLPRLWGRLLTCRATIASPDGEPGTAPEVEITLPDGQTVTAGDARADAALSALAGRPVRLSSQPPELAEIERYWPDIEGMAQRDVETSNAIGAGAPPGTFFDFAPVHLLTTVSLARLRALYPSGYTDVRRFRPNLLIAPLRDEEGFVENDWVGRVLLIGDTLRLRIITPTPRCVVPTLPQADIPNDIGILRTIAAQNRPPIPIRGGAKQPSLGVYAVVEQPGVVRLEDAVRFA